MRGKGERRRYRKEWRWRTSGKVDWEKYRQKVGEKMGLFSEDMMCEVEGGWTARRR